MLGCPSGADGRRKMCGRKKSEAVLALTREPHRIFSASNGRKLYLNFIFLARLDFKSYNLIYLSIFWSIHVWMGCPSIHIGTAPSGGRDLALCVGLWWDRWCRDSIPSKTVSRFEVFWNCPTLEAYHWLWMERRNRQLLDKPEELQNTWWRVEWRRSIRSFYKPDLIHEYDRSGSGKRLLLQSNLNQGSCDILFIARNCRLVSFLWCDASVGSGQRGKPDTTQPIANSDLGDVRTDWPTTKNLRSNPTRSILQTDPWRTDWASGSENSNSTDRWTGANAVCSQSVLGSLSKFGQTFTHHGSNHILSWLRSPTVLHPQPSWLHGDFGATPSSPWRRL